MLADEARVVFATFVRARDNRLGPIAPRVARLERAPRSMCRLNLMLLEHMIARFDRFGKIPFRRLRFDPKFESCRKRLARRAHDLTISVSDRGALRGGDALPVEFLILFDKVIQTNGVARGEATLDVFGELCRRPRAEVDRRVRVEIVEVPEKL